MPQSVPRLKTQELEAKEKKIKAAFDVFDQSLNGTVDVREIGTILRSIGIFPSLEQLHQWVTEMEEDEPSGYIVYARFKETTLKILSETYPVQSDEETLYRAFQALDTEKKGFLLPDELRNYMTTMGEAFTKEEVEEMLAACTDPVENKIFYEDYAQILAK